jgi:hypothetical protein
MFSQFMLHLLHLDPTPEFSQEIFNILMTEKNLGSWHDIMASISQMLCYIIYILMKYGSYHLTANNVMTCYFFN